MSPLKTPHPSFLIFFLLAPFAGFGAFQLLLQLVWEPTFWKGWVVHRFLHLLALFLVQTWRWGFVVSESLLKLVAEAEHLDELMPLLLNAAEERANDLLLKVLDPLVQVPGHEFCVYCTPFFEELLCLPFIPVPATKSGPERSWGTCCWNIWDFQEVEGAIKRCKQRSIYRSYVCLHFLAVWGEISLFDSDYRTHQEVTLRKESMSNLSIF